MIALFFFFFLVPVVWSRGLTCLVASGRPPFFEGVSEKDIRFLYVFGYMYFRGAWDELVNFMRLGFVWFLLG